MVSAGRCCVADPFFVLRESFFFLRLLRRTPYQRLTYARKKLFGIFLFNTLAARRTAFHGLAGTARHRGTHRPAKPTPCVP